MNFEIRQRIKFEGCIYGSWNHGEMFDIAYNCMCKIWCGYKSCEFLRNPTIFVRNNVHIAIFTFGAIYIHPVCDCMVCNVWQKSGLIYGSICGETRRRGVSTRIFSKPEGVKRRWRQISIDWIDSAVTKIFSCEGKCLLGMQGRPGDLKAGKVVEVAIFILRMETDLNSAPAHSKSSAENFGTESWLGFNFNFIILLSTWQKKYTFHKMSRAVYKLRRNKMSGRPYNKRLERKTSSLKTNLLSNLKYTWIRILCSWSKTIFKKRRKLETI